MTTAHPITPHSSDTTPAGRARLAAAIAQAMKSADADECYLCDGFRAPDEAILIKDVPLEATLFGHQDLAAYAAGSLITSSFWVGPREAAEPLLSAIADAWTATVRESEPDPDDGNSILIALWCVPDSTDVLVGALGNGELSANLFSPLEADGMTAAAFDGNDNGPCQVWEDGVEEVKASRLAHILESTVVDEAWNEVRELIAESHPKMARKLRP